MSNKPTVKHILLAYDASEEADQAFEFARAFAERFEADLEVLSVVFAPKFAEMPETRAALEEGAQRMKRGHRRLRHVTQGEHFAVHFLTKFGRPTEQILATAEEVSADLIVMGHRHRSVLERGFSRSTALKVLESAPCPVLIVP